jgi:hypothetical protein
MAESWNWEREHNIRGLLNHRAACAPRLLVLLLVERIHQASVGSFNSRECLRSLLSIASFFLCASY